MERAYDFYYEYYSFNIKSGTKRYQGVIALVHAPIGVIGVEEYDFLDRKDREYIRKFKDPQKQADIILGRFAAKKAISKIQEIELQYISIEKGIFNQPIAAGRGIKNIQVTMSHAKNYGIAIAYTEGLIMGVDLEMNIIQCDAIKLSEYESKILEKFQMSKNIIWSVREALIKCLKANFFLSAKVLELSGVEMKNGIIRGSFRYFRQYCFQVCCKKKIAIAVVYPLELKDLLQIEEFELLKNRVHYEVG